MHIEKSSLHLGFISCKHILLEILEIVWILLNVSRAQYLQNWFSFLLDEILFYLNKIFLFLEYFYRSCSLSSYFISMEYFYCQNHFYRSCSIDDQLMISIQNKTLTLMDRKLPSLLERVELQICWAHRTSTSAIT